MSIDVDEIENRVRRRLAVTQARGMGQVPICQFTISRAHPPLRRHNIDTVSNRLSQHTNV